jgi:hypothetical protein
LAVTNNSTTTKKRRKLRVYYALMAVFFIVVGAFLVFRIGLRSKLDARIDAIRAAGYPVTPAELDAWYTIPASAENGADYIVDAFSWYQKSLGAADPDLAQKVYSAELPARAEPVDEATKNLIARHIADNQQALELLHKGAAAEHSRYPVDLTAGFDALMPYLSEIRDSARLLKLEAVLHAENAEPQLAADSVAAGFGLARSLAKEPLIISQLVRIACEALAISTLEQLVNRTELTDQQLAELGRCIDNAENLADMPSAFIGERCLGIALFKEPGLVDGSVVSVPAGPILRLYEAVGLADKCGLIYLDLMGSYIRTIQLPTHRRQEAADAIDAKIEATPKIYILLHTLMPALARVTTLDIRSIAQLRTARAGLAIQRYRLATDKLPDTLADLVPAYLDAVPKDPFDGNDLRYKKLETGFVVYSIGEDRSDDGGKERPSKRERGSKPANWDVTFIIER